MILHSPLGVKEMKDDFWLLMGLGYFQNWHAAALGRPTVSNDLLKHTTWFLVTNGPVSSKNPFFAVCWMCYLKHMISLLALSFPFLSAFCLEETVMSISQGWFENHYWHTESTWHILFSVPQFPFSFLTVKGNSLAQDERKYLIFPK